VQRTVRSPSGKGTARKTSPSEPEAFQEVLERKQAELARALRNRDDIIIEKSAGQMDEIQYARERDLAIRKVDRDSGVLREVARHYAGFATIALESVSSATKR